MNSSSSIFLKRTELDESGEKIDSIPLTKCDVISSIPKNFVKKEDTELSKNNTEWRWRIFKFPNKKNEVVEISFKKPNEKRMYINRTGEWVNRDINSEFNKFVVDEYYVYSN